MHKKIIILFIIFFSNFSCILQTNFFDKLNYYYRKGNFNKMIELIQIEELNNESFRNDIELYLWKGRIYSINAETYGIAQSYYEMYIQKKQNPDIYLEYTLFLMDLKDFNRIKNLISGENIPPAIIFHPHISDIRNFIECYNKVGKLNFINVIKNSNFIQHPFFYNYCIILNINFLKKNNPSVKLSTTEEKILNDLNLSSIDTIKTTIEEIDFHINQLKPNEINKKEYFSALKNILESYIDKNKVDYRDRQYENLCSIQRHFSNISIVPIDLEICKKLYPNNPALYRQIKNFEITEYKVEPYFQNDIYLP